MEGVAKLKAEFLIREQPAGVREARACSADSSAATDAGANAEQLPSEADTNAATDAVTSTEQQPSGAPARKRQRGMNKKRGLYRPGKPEINLCTAIKQGRSCPYGNSCKFSHDLEAYQVLRPLDLGETCPIYSLHGYCRFGVACRFGSSHLRTNTLPDKPIESHERNSTLNSLTARLRKHQYDFSIAAAAIKQWEAISQDSTNLPDDEAAGSSTATAGASAALDDISPASAEAAPSAAAEPEGERYDATEAEKPKLESHYESGSVVSKEKKKVDFRGKLYLAPLTTVGNMPFRRICKGYGADITCSEMALAPNLLQGQASEWALLKRHVSEDVFGAQIAGNSIEQMARAAQLLDAEVDIDFIDINMGCPIDIICNRGMGAGLAPRTKRVQGIVRCMSSVLSVPLTVKLRMGFETDKPTAHNLIPKLSTWGAAAVTLHGRSRQQRYTKLADWSYISQCAQASALPLIGNGDGFSYEDLDSALRADTGISSMMLARGALVKPWIFTEMKERRHWDISASERLEILRTFVRNGLEHWGTDDVGVSRTRNFLLEWLSFLHRYIPVGILERVPSHLQERPPLYRGRNDLETLMASPLDSDWVKISEMLLGPVPADFHFTPKHKSNANPSLAITSEG